MADETQAVPQTETETETPVVLQATALIQMSPQTAKDLHVALGHQLTLHEETWGPIETEYARSVSRQVTDYIETEYTRSVSRQVTDYKVISTSVFPALTEVRLYNETIKHVEEEHPEIPANLPCIQTAVKNAIIDPTHIELSYENSFVYTDAATTNASGDPLRIPIKGIE